MGHTVCPRHLTLSTCLATWTVDFPAREQDRQGPEPDPERCRGHEAPKGSEVVLLGQVCENAHPPSPPSVGRMQC